MGLFDTVKAKAGELAADAERAGKVAAAQARAVALQNDVRRAERELGRAAYDLMEQGERPHTDLDASVEAVAAAREALAQNEREIAELRGEAAEPSAPGDTPARPETTTVLVATPETEAAGAAAAGKADAATAPDSPDADGATSSAAGAEAH